MMLQLELQSERGWAPERDRLLVQGFLTAMASHLFRK